MTLGKITPESAGAVAAVAIITAQPGIRTAQIAQKADWTLNHAQKLLREVARLGLIHALREDGNHCAWFAPQHIEEAAEAAKLAAKDRKRRENKREHERRKMRVRSGSDPWKYRDLPDSPTHSAADAKAPLPFKLRPGAVRSVFDLGAA